MGGGLTRFSSLTPAEKCLSSLPLVLASRAQEVLATERALGALADTTDEVWFKTVTVTQDGSKKAVIRGPPLHDFLGNIVSTSQVVWLLASRIALAQLQILK